jgi:holo-[acyl-carrier protein] synthase
MIDSLGIDIIETSRIKKALFKWEERFKKRVFSSSEVNYCQKKKFPEVSFAARFCAKEAAMKALGTGVSQGVGWKDFEVVNLKSGKPELRISERIQKRIGKGRFILSLSHTKEYAVAVVLLLNE